MEINNSEFLIVNLAEEIVDGETVVQGTSTFFPLVSTLLAKETKKINLIGGFMTNPEIVPKIPSTFCPDNYKNENSFLNLSGFLDMLQNNKIDLEFLRPAQVDKYGNINNTIIGDYKSPKVRLPGGMGFDDVMTFVKKIILYVPNHSRRIFVEKVDFVTAHGWNTGKGPFKIITNMCVFEFPDKKITLTKINPNYTIEDIKKETGFEFDISEKIGKMILPDREIINLINILDPLRLRDLEIKEKRESILKNLI